MFKTAAQGLAASAMLLVLSACSMGDPDSHTFVTSNPSLAAISALPEKKSGNKGNPNREKKDKVPATEDEAMKKANSDCKTEARDKSVKSVMAIFSHLKPGSVDADYIECMKNKGYDVSK